MCRIGLVASLVVTAVSSTCRAEELPKAEPAEVGLSAKALEGIEPALQKIVNDGEIAGAVALVMRHGKVAYVGVVGDRDLASDASMTEDTIFAIASMSKPITCVAAMTLVEAGTLGLDDPVGDYLPELKGQRVLGDPKDDVGDEIATVPADRPVTIRHLLAHTSGFAYGGFLAADPRLARAYERANVMDRDVKTIAEQVGRLAEVPLAHQPGAGWTYGLSHDVLGRVIEVVSGRGFDDYLQEHLFTPLDMTDTSFYVPESKRERLATIYRAGRDGDLVEIPRDPGSETMFSGGGGLYSTARDYARFAQMLLDGGTLDGAQILRPESIELMITNQIGEKTAFGGKYGLGFGLDFEPAGDGEEPTLDLYHWGGLFSTNFWIDPRDDLVGVIMTQVLPTNHGDAIGTFGRIVAEAIED